MFNDFCIHEWEFEYLVYQLRMLLTLLLQNLHDLSEKYWFICHMLFILKSATLKVFLSSEDHKECFFIR